MNVPLASTDFARLPEAARLPLRPELRCDLNHPGTSVVHPTGSGYAAVALALADALAAVNGPAPIVIAETDSRPPVGTGPLIVLGNLMVSALVRRLYFEAYDFTDHAFPGPGGWVVRTLGEPWGAGRPIVLVGGSDLAGVQAAAAALVAHVRESGPALGYLNRVQLGQWADAGQLEVARYLGSDDAVWERVGQSGSWDYIDHIAKCGTGYLRTGDERYLAAFQRELHRFIAQDVLNTHPEAPPMLHGRMYVLLTVWDLVSDHPRFAAEERRQVDAMFLHVAESAEGAAQIAAVADTWAVRYNHHTRAGLDAFFVGRFFARRYGLPEAQAWLDLAARLFAPQLASAKPACDSWGHQWGASLCNTLIYALATGRMDYAASPVLRAAADRALLAYGWGAPRHYLAACAVATGDSGYLSLETSLPELARDAAQLRLQPVRKGGLVNFTDEVLRTFTTDAPIRRREDLLGQAVAPLDALWHQTIETPVYNPDGIFVVDVSPAEGFDKLALRDGWGADDFYLLLDGISGGHHAYQDANALVWLRERGVDWFLPRTGYRHALGPRWQNGVNVALNGRGPGRIPRYARLLYRGTDGEFSAVGTRLDGGGETVWERHLLRRRGAWTLVLDRVIAGVSGELLAERSWFPRGECAVCTDGFSSRQAEAWLHLATAESVRDEGAGQMVERRRAAVAAGDAVALAGLLWASDDARADAWILRATAGGWSLGPRDGDSVAVELRQQAGVGCGLQVTHGARSLVLGASGESWLPPQVKSLPLVPVVTPVTQPWREVRLAGQVVSAVAGRAGGFAVGTAEGTVVAFDAAGGECWRGQVKGPVLSLEWSDGNVIVGEERGALTWFDARGEPRWTKEIPWVTLPWAYWSEERSRIRELAVADIDGDGAAEVLVSNADRRVYAFDRNGCELWKRPIEWGVFTAMWPAADDGRFALWGGTSRPSIHGYAIRLGADGAVAGRCQRSDLICWSMPAAMRDLLVADIDGDGADEIVTAVDTNCRQLIAYEADGTLRWDLDVGAGASALAFESNARRVLCASDAGYVVAVSGATGRREWCAWIGVQVQLLWVLPDRRVLALTAAGTGWVLAASGEVQESFDLGSRLTAVPRPGNHRGAARRLVLGTADGRVLVPVR
ncbi:MAG: hypothetical protein KF897_12915 [Opitutaceae bacterium]|nr:hypothetical protein [Opitutaceae bacterium]